MHFFFCHSKVLFLMLCMVHLWMQTQKDHKFEASLGYTDSVSKKQKEEEEEAGAVCRGVPVASDTFQARLQLW